MSFYANANSNPQGDQASLLGPSYSYKNQIKTISYLQNLTYLNTLDLNSNLIESVQGIERYAEGYG